MRNRHNIYWALAALLGFGIFVWMEFFVSVQKQESQSSAYSSQGRGLSFFYKLAQFAGEKKLELSGRLFNEVGELKTYKTLALLSPKTSLRKDQREIYKQFIEEGGRMILSFEDEKDFLYINEFLLEMGASLRVKKRQNFTNKVLSLLSPLEASSLFSPRETYAIYSQYEIENSSCHDEAFECFVFRQSFESGGELWVMAGLPLFANALIQNNDNRVMAFRLLNDLSPLLLDEYSHFYSDYNFLTLLKQPRFLFPFFGFCLSIFLFLFFSHALQDEEENFEEDLEKPSELSLTFHEFNENILYSTLAPSSSYAAALKQHWYFLKKKFPREKLEANSFVVDPKKNLLSQFLKEGLRLLQIHQKFLNQKGKK